MSNTQLTRGSEWRKWDLHVHTKDTNKNDQFKSVSFDNFCTTMFKKALEKEIKAIGITDYFCINNYKRVVEYQKNIQSNDLFNDDEKSKITEIFILPNVELRMLPVTDTGRLINIHCIFNPDFVPSLDNDFFNTLKYVGGDKDYLMNKQGIISLGRYLDTSIVDDTVAYKKGISNFVVSHESLKKTLDSNSNLRENIIIAVSNSSNDGASAIQKHYDLFENDNGSLDGVRKAICEISDCIFSANQSDVDFFAGKKSGCSPDIVKQKCGSLKPCIHGSDAHTEEKLFNPDNDRFCWIKADLNFNGLKQILYEPDERVKILQDKPDEKRGYQVIDYIVLNEDKFWNQTIYFNENLNTIIGGRSTGKSTLLKAIAKKNDSKIELVDENEFIDKHLGGVSVMWRDGEKDIERDIDFFPQSYMHEIAKDKEKTNSLIKKIIRNKSENQYLIDYESKNNEIKKIISKNILDVFQLQSDITNLQKLLKEKGDKKGVETEIGRLNNKIQELNKNAKITEKELEEYQSLLKKIAEKEWLVKQSDNDLLIISNFKSKSIVDVYFINEFDDLTSSIKESIIVAFNKLKAAVDSKWIEYIGGLEQSINANKQKYLNEVENIKKQMSLRKEHSIIVITKN
jgi:hypothetical protein